MNIASHITGTALALTMIAQTAFAGNAAPQTELAATVKFPEFVCWQNDKTHGPLAIFTQSLYEGGVYGTDTDGIPTEDGHVSYEQSHIEYVGDPSNYGHIEGNEYFRFDGSQVVSFEALLGSHSEFDQAAILEAIKAFNNRDSKCPLIKTDPAMLLG